MNWVNIGSGNVRRQAITWNHSDLLSIGLLGINFIKIQIKIQYFWFMKMYLKMSSAKWWPFCLGGYKLRGVLPCWAISKSGFLSLMTLTLFTCSNMWAANNGTYQLLSLKLKYISKLISHICWYSHDDAISRIYSISFTICVMTKRHGCALTRVYLSSPY